MDGLTQLYIFKQKLHCERFDLSRAMDGLTRLPWMV